MMTLNGYELGSSPFFPFLGSCAMIKEGSYMAFLKKVLP